ncbi:Ribonuclease Z [subsurface metagenome]
MTFSLTILGNSSAIPTSTRYTSAHVLNVHERFFLIDCGEGTQMQLRKHKIKLGKINHIFISHLHGDHTFGLFGLLSSYGILNRKADLHIYASPDLERIINDNVLAFNIFLPYKLAFHDLDCSRSERIYEDENIWVETIPLKHRIATCGFLFREKPKLKNIRKEAIEKYRIPVKEIIRIKEGADFKTSAGQIISNMELTLDPPKPRSFAYCADTCYHKGIITKINNVDLLYHEATYTHDLADRAKETYHSTSYEAALLASEAKVGKLVLGHFSPRYKNLDILLNEARKVFKNTFIGEEGLTFSIE